MSKFNVGDKVIGNKSASLRYSITKEGYIGTVTAVCSDAVICLDDAFNVEAWRFDIYSSDRHSIHITCTDNKTTHAVKKVGGKIVARSKAVCCPTDEFDFAVGAQLAFNRLAYGTDYNPAEVALAPEQPKQEDKPTYKSGDKVKVLANTNSHGYAIGDIVTLCGDRHETEFLHKFYWSTDERGFYVREDDIEPYTEPESTEPKLIVTKRMLDEMGACNSGVRAFMESFPGGEGEFDAVVAKAKEVGRNGDARWLEHRKFMVEQRQNEPKREPVKLYCVKDCFSWFKKGKTYTLRHDGAIVFEDGWIASKYKSVDDFKGRNRSASDCIYQLVSRPAKVGEWVYVDGTGNSWDGKIGKVIGLTDRGLPRIEHDTVWFDNGKGKETTIPSDPNCILVLDGYKPEPEKAEPEYLNMRVVCVKLNHGLSHTVGKVYEVKDGFLASDDSSRYNPWPYNTLDDLNKDAAADFIEFKGE